MDNFFYFNIDCPHKRLQYFKQWVKTNYYKINNFSYLFYQAIISHHKVLRNNFEIIKYFVEFHKINPSEYIKYYRYGVVFGCYCPVIESAMKGDLDIVQYFISLIFLNDTQETIEYIYGNILYTSSSTNNIKIFEYIVGQFLDLGAKGGSMKGYAESKIKQLKKIIVKLYECEFSFRQDQRIYIEESATDDDHILLLPRCEALIFINHKLEKYRKLIKVLKKELNEQYMDNVKGITDQNDIRFADNLIMSYLMV